MLEGWWVKAADIEKWVETNSREAKEILPLLLRKLIIVSLNPSDIIIRTGDSILTKGWDGILNVKHGNAFVPSGQKSTNCIFENIFQQHKNGVLCGRHRHLLLEINLFYKVSNILYGLFRFPKQLNIIQISHVLKASLN